LHCLSITTSFGFVIRNTVCCVSILVWDTHLQVTWCTTQYSTGLHWNVLYMHMTSIVWPLPLMECTILCWDWLVHCSSSHRFSVSQSTSLSFRTFPC